MMAFIVCCTTSYCNEQKAQKKRRKKQPVRMRFLCFRHRNQTKNGKCIWLSQWNHIHFRYRQSCTHTNCVIYLIHQLPFSVSPPHIRTLHISIIIMIKKTRFRLKMVRLLFIVILVSLNQIINVSDCVWCVRLQWHYSP